MDFSFREEQQQVRDLARQILEDLVGNDRLKQVEASEEGIDRSTWEALAGAHLLGVAIPEEHGGSGLGFHTLCVLLEEVGRAVAPIPALASLVLGALPIARFGSPEQRRRWLPEIAGARTLLSGALEEEGNPDPARPHVAARPDGDVWRLDGRKILVPAAHVAARILVPAATGEGRVGLFLVDPRGAGVSLERQRTTDRQTCFQLDLAGARVGADEVLGDPASAAKAVQWIAERAAAGLCAMQLGVAERALRMTAEYTSSRQQFGRPIGSFQAVHMRAGDAFIQVEAMRLTCAEAAWRLDQERPATDQVAVAKYWAAEGGQFVGYAAQHLHGGIGIDVDYPLHRYYLWAKQIELCLGSAPVQLAGLGERLARGTLSVQA
jgi:alkylation response protein AidB-like acyl-CoA dehydrogenase